MNKKVLKLIVNLIVLLVFAGCSGERKVKYDVYYEGQNVKGYSETQLLQEINRLELRYNEDPVQAKLNDNNWEIALYEKHGKAINKEKTLEKVLNAKKDEKVKSIVTTVKPDLTANKIKSNLIELSSFSTKITDQRVARQNNILIAADCINNTKIIAGDIFSFNDILGKRTQEKGYEKAPIIIKTKKGPKKAYGIGGGICQLSSTLYNAVKLSGMEIIERHSHSKKITYLPLGEDASVSYGYHDFKFRNNKNMPIMIKIYVDKNNLTVKIIGNSNTI